MFEYGVNAEQIPFWRLLTNQLAQLVQGSLQGIVAEFVADRLF
jgi:hypothetical protein